MEAKRVLRKQLLKRRAALSRAEVERASLAMLQHWKDRFPLTQGYLHVFQSMKARNEVETSYFTDWIRLSHPRVNFVIPVVEGEVLGHAVLSPDLPVQESAWGILEPAGTYESVDPGSLDMVLVPMLGYNRARYRLGYGKGYYDHFLARTRCPKIGLCYAQGLVEDLPVEPHDVALDWIITEEGVL